MLPISVDWNRVPLGRWSVSLTTVPWDRTSEAAVGLSSLACLFRGFEMSEVGCDWFKA